MKKLLLILLTALATLPLCGQADAIEKYFNRYLEDDRFTVVYISPKMFNMVAKMDIKDMDPDVKEVISELKGLRILTTEVNALQLYKEALATINTKEYEILMKVRDGEENVHFLAKDNGGDTIHELLLLVGGQSDFVLLSFIGNIDLKKISKLANSMDLKGVEHLDKIEKQ